MWIFSPAARTSSTNNMRPRAFSIRIRSTRTALFAPTPPTGPPRTPSPRAHRLPSGQACDCSSTDGTCRGDVLPWHNFHCGCRIRADDSRRSCVLPLRPHLWRGEWRVIAVPDIGRVGGLIAALVLAGSAQAQNPLLPAGVEQAAHSYITRATLEAAIRFLSSDLLEGRGPATRGDELARLYLQTRLEGMGYQPAFANGAWQQPFDIVGLKGQFPKSWSFQGRSARVDLSWREDYIAVSGVQKECVS